MIMIFTYNNDENQVYPIRIVAVVYEAEVVSRVRHWDMNTMTVETTQTLLSFMNTLTLDIVVLYAYCCFTCDWLELERIARCFK